MKKYILGILLCYPLWGMAHEGIPFFVNYPSATYGAHNRNFDILCTPGGHVYAANFEGVLHYDYNRWEMLYAPDYSRVTRLYTDRAGRIWVGGYHLLGCIRQDCRGKATLFPLVTSKHESLTGEVEDLAETGGRIYVKTTTGKYYTVISDTLLIEADSLSPAFADRRAALPGINQTLMLNGGIRVDATNRGLFVHDGEGGTLFTLSEQNGLCSNRIARIAADGHGNLWGATDNGLFRVTFPAPFSRYTPDEGLKGEVVSVRKFRETLYAGTLHGLYFLQHDRFLPVGGITQACWDLCVSPAGQLYAATSDGVFRIDNRNRVHKVAATDAFTLAFDGNTTCLLGAVDGIYCHDFLRHHTRKIAPLEKVVCLQWQEDSSLFARTLYGENYLRRKGVDGFVRRTDDGPAPRTRYTDRAGYCWQTDLQGKNLQVTRSGKPVAAWNCSLAAVRHQVVRVIYTDSEKSLWLGGDFGLIWMDLCLPHDFSRQRPALFIREICLNSDSVYAGSYALTAAEKERSTGNIEHMAVWEHRVRDVRFTFATDAPSPGGENSYRWLLEGYDTGWVPWQPAGTKEYTNLPPGTYHFRVQARDVYKRESEIKTFSFTLLPPFWLQWYCLAGYLLLAAALVWGLFKWRMQRLLREKAKLEILVSERTRQLTEQKNEIEEKSVKLQETLEELGRTQNDLVQQEKLATVGKLTQGLIDRILNPLNYINNFTRLTSGLLADLHENLEEEPGKDNRGDSLEIIGMIGINLEKIGEHGQNTARILKAMEEVLKNRSGQMERLELNALCHKALELLNNYYHEDITRLPVVVSQQLPAGEVWINGNAAQLTQTIMSLLNNGMYAIRKKHSKQVYPAQISLGLTQTATGEVFIRIRDNGIGIEPGITDKIFDPFFTTKTTGEAAGIGLYLSREIILNHGGHIRVDSVKDVYTEFCITLPPGREPSDRPEANHD